MHEHGGHNERELGRSPLPDDLRSGESQERFLDVLGVKDPELREAARERIERLAEESMLDPLTGLRNARALIGDGEIGEWSEAALQAKREGRTAVLVLFDLQGFKEINDGHGQRVGDEVLREIGGAVRDRMRAGEHGYRLGGDEFALVLMDVDAARAKEVLDRIAEAFPLNPATREMVELNPTKQAIKVYDPERSEDATELLLQAMDDLRKSEPILE